MGTHNEQKKKKHRLDLQELIIIQLTKVIKNNTFLDTMANAFSLILYLFSDYVSKFEFLIYSSVNKTQLDCECTAKSHYYYQPLFGIQCHVLSFLVGNAP